MNDNLNGVLRSLMTTINVDTPVPALDEGQSEGIFHKTIPSLAILLPDRLSIPMCNSSGSETPRTLTLNAPGKTSRVDEYSTRARQGDGHIDPDRQKDHA
jgi:hypothetical protein